MRDEVSFEDSKAKGKDAAFYSSTLLDNLRVYPLWRCTRLGLLPELMERLTPSNSCTTKKHHFGGCARHNMKWEPKLSISAILHPGIEGYSNLGDGGRYQMRGQWTYR